MNAPGQYPPVILSVVRRSPNVVEGPRVRRQSLRTVRKLAAGLYRRQVQTTNLL